VVRVQETIIVRAVLLDPPRQFLGLKVELLVVTVEHAADRKSQELLLGNSMALDIVVHQPLDVVSFVVGDLDLVEVVLEGPFEGLGDRVVNLQLVLLVKQGLVIVNHMLHALYLVKAVFVLLVFSHLKKEPLGARGTRVARLRAFDS